MLEKDISKIRKMARERNIMQSINTFNQNANSVNPKHTKKIWDFLKWIRKRKENKQLENFTPLKKKNGEFTRTLDENLIRWEEWVKEMFQIDDETPKTFHYKKELWDKDLDTIKNHIEKYNKDDTPEKRKAKMNRKNSTLKDAMKKDKELEEFLSKPISKDEVRRAIKSLKNNKSFGNDRIPAEMYKENIEIMEDVIYEIICISVKQGKLIDDWAEGIITLLRKKNDRADPNNYRPICLLNISYKILSVIVCTRLNPIMNILTKETQTAYKNNRSTYDIISIIEKYTKEYKCKQNSYKSITLIDLSKAFDRMNRQKMLTILAEKGLPAELIRIIHIMHKNTKLQPKQSNRLGQKIYNNNGCFQGSPLSALVFVIYADEMMNRYEQELKKQRGNAKNASTENINIRSENAEKEWTRHKLNEKTKHEGKQKDAPDEPKVFKHFASKKTIKQELDHLEYADDTNLFNNSVKDEQEKGVAYKTAATEYEMLLQLTKTKIIRKNAGAEKNAGLCEPLHEINESKFDKILGLYLSFDRNNKKLHSDRLNKGKAAYHSLSSFVKNHRYDKKQRYRMADSLVRPIFTYGYAALSQDRRNENKIEVEMNKIYRHIEEAEENENYRKNKNKTIDETPSEPKNRKTNNQIRIENNIKTIESQLIKERAKFSINAKQTLSIAYNYDKPKHERNIKEAIAKLEKIKKTLITPNRNIYGILTLEDQAKQRKVVRSRQISEINIPCQNEECVNNLRKKTLRKNAKEETARQKPPKLKKKH